MKQFHIVYKTTNLINGRFYVGIHSTNNLEDNYLGSGWVLKQAIKRYGKYNFIREILFIYPTRKEAILKETEIVNKKFIKDDNNYNLVLGGGGCFDQTGEKNHQFGKVGQGAKRVRAIHKDGTTIEASSIQELSKVIHIARANIRNLINKDIIGKRGWRVAHY